MSLVDSNGEPLTARPNPIKSDERLANSAYNKFRRGEVCTRMELSSVFTLFNYYHKKHFLLSELLMKDFALTPQEIEERIIAMMKGETYGKEKSVEEKTEEKVT